MPPPAACPLGVVVNPTAGKGRAVRAGVVVVDTLRAAGHGVCDLSAGSAELALGRARDAVDRGELGALVVVGGDGMVHLGAQAVAGTTVPLGVVAVGTGNDFACTLGLPVGDPGAGCQALRAALDAGRHGVRPVDAAHVSGPGLTPAPPGAAGRVRWVAGAVSAGLDAAVNARANAMLRPRGSARYTLAAVRELLGYRPWSYRLTFDGVAPAEGPPHGLHLRPGPAGTATWTGRAALVTAANGPRIGGGIRVAPHARVDDGYLDVVVATDLSRPGAAAVFPSMFAGAHLRARKVHVVRARAVTVEPGPDAWASGERALPAAYGDGERLGPLPLRVEARAGALRVLVPPPAA
ncbi:diacylglycerol/lipid kinase family protein [Isoptericola hypogeus]|uniref:diacylglycerol/lipid kinase family protein n=1 Tax=Isoptericola hypogeus TaxID=300179 RepID=UPI0031CF65D5